MAGCYSTAGVLALPTVYVVSRINRLMDCLRAVALPGIQFKAIELNDFEPSEDQINEMNNAEIGIFDPSLLMRTYRYMPGLKWAHSTWAGLDPMLSLDFHPNEPPFIITRHASNAFSVTMAEYVVGHIISWERKFKLCWKSQQTKTWLANDIFTNYRTLDQLKVAILGVGNMGSAVAKFLKDRGTTVLGLARNPNNQNPAFDKIFTQIEDILPECDYICNTLPNTLLTLGMLNNSILQKCTKKPVFINVGRGSIISETELIFALRSGWLSGAVLDVFENEPLPESSELWNMDQVTITPHVSALSDPKNIAEDFIDNLTHFTDGHGLKNVYSWTDGY